MVSINVQRIENTEIFQSLESSLNKDKSYKPLLDYLEESTNLNRVYIVIGCGFLLTAPLFLHFGIQLICSAIGFLYPGYKTIECLENFDVQQGKKWLTYWIVASAFNFFEIFLFFLDWLPGYWILKCIFFAWCFAPLTNNGSDVIYKFLIRPYFIKNHEAIDETFNSVVKVALHMSSERPMGSIKYGETHLD